MKAYVFALLLMGVTAAQAESALTVRATDLMAQAQADAAKVAALPENTKVDILRRVGAWSEVKSAAGQGWVRMMSLKPESAGTGSTTSGSAGLASLLNSGRSSNTATVTAGVKGLTKEDLSRAQPNFEEFRKMQRYAVGKDGARSFAQRNKLSVASVDYLEGSAFAGGGNNDSGSTPGMTGM